MEQIKKNPNDPDVQDLNPDIIRLAKSTKWIRDSVEMYLHGKLTWMEALELMVLIVTKEHKAQQAILVRTLQEAGPSATLMLAGASGPLLKCLPARPISRPDEILVNETVLP